MFWIKSCAKQQILFDDLSKESAAAQITIEPHIYFQMEVCKSLETISGMILNLLQPTFAAKKVANEIFESHEETCTD